MSSPFVDGDKSNILSQDLLVYITHLEEAFNNIEESEEKTIIQEWLTLVVENPHETIAEARIRNMVLSQMLMDIENNKLRFPFNERPTKRAYGELVDWLTSMLNQNASTEEENDVEDEGEPENHELDLDECKEFVSIDNRTYVAIRTLPNGSGIFGYVAVSLGEENDTQWLNSKGQPITTPVPSNLPVEQVKGDLEELMPKRCDVKKVWYVLKHRKPSDLRADLLTFYQTLYESVQREMVAERNKNIKCYHPFIVQLLAHLEAELKCMGVSDHKLFCRIKMLSILKKQIKYVLAEIEKRAETLDTTMRLSKISPITILPPKCCYNFVSSTLWEEIAHQRPANKYMDILTLEYPECLFPKYFLVLAREKKNILTNIFSKYCKILDEMFADLSKAIMSNMKKYRDVKWEWHLAFEIIDAYNKEKAFKDSLCATETSADENAESFLTVILNEMEMAGKKLKSIVKKNDQITAQIPELRNEIGDRERVYKSIVSQYECKMEKFRKDINNEKNDILKRDNTIAELQRRLNDLMRK